MLEFERWGIFANGGGVYRLWSVPARGIPELGIAGGLKVLDDARGHVWLYDPAGGGHGRTIDAWEMPLLFSGERPSWGPTGPFLTRFLGTELSTRMHDAVAEAATLAEQHSGLYSTPEPPVERSCMPEGVAETLAALGLPDDTPWGFYVVTKAIPAIGARPGDVLAYSRDVDGLRAVPHRIGREAYAEAADDVAAGAVVGLHPYASPQRLARSLRGSARHAGRAKPETAPLVLLRPLLSPVSEPVEAHDDLSALFELVASTGGRLTAD